MNPYQILLVCTLTPVALAFVAIAFIKLLEAVPGWVASEPPAPAKPQAKSDIRP